MNIPNKYKKWELWVHYIALGYLVFLFHAYVGENLWETILFVGGADLAIHLILKELTGWRD